MSSILFNNITPLSVNKLPMREVRALYSGLRSILRKRNERATAKSLSVKYPTPLPVKDVPADLIRKETANIAAQLRDPMTTIKGRSRRTNKIKATLTEHGYDVASENLDDFGRFMELARKRMKDRYKGMSAAVAVAYEEFKKTGVSGKTIERYFSKFMEDSDKLNDLMTLARTAHEQNGGKRVTANQLREEVKKVFGDEDNNT